MQPQLPTGALGNNMLRERKVNVANGGTTESNTQAKAKKTARARCGSCDG